MTDIESRLRRLKPEVADQFARIGAVLRADLSETEFAQWGDICWTLADAGWHGWEVTNDFIALSLDLANDPTQLLQVGDYCTALVSTSFEPGKTYLRGVAELNQRSDYKNQRAKTKSTKINSAEINGADKKGAEAKASQNRDEQSLLLIHETGREILNRFQQSSNMHANFFKTAFAIAIDQDLDMLSAWCRLASLNARLERSSLFEFLDLSFAAQQQNWIILADIGVCHRDNAMAYLKFSGKIRYAISPVEQPLAELALTYSKGQQSIDEWLLVLGKVLPLLTESQARALIEYTGLLNGVFEATALAETASRLPLTQHEVLNAWLEGRPVNENEKIRLAYLKLESAVSEQCLQELLGQVQLHEEQRLLQLYAEAMSGTRLKIEVGEGLPSSDGQVIRLPSLIDQFKDRSENFRWLKTALIHQLGCYEFGTFDYRRGDSFIAFEDQFRSFEQPMLAETLFTICESARVDWLVARRYRGAAADLLLIKTAAAQDRAFEGLSQRRQLLESMVLYSLDTRLPKPLAESVRVATVELFKYMDQLKDAGADVQTSMAVMAACYSIVSGTEIDVKPLEPVLYRGLIAFDDASINLQLTALEDLEADFADSDDDGVQMTGASDEANPNIDELQAGDVDNPSAVISADEDMIVPDDLDRLEDPAGMQKMERLKQERKEPAEITYRYDEWDYVIEDYRRRWCTLYEFRNLEQDVDFVPDTLSEHRALATKVRRQLNMLRPELLRKVKGVADGEELDLERAIEAVVDRKSGVSPSENIYIQRQRKERDVAALFLLDMSASTDDLIEAEATVYVENDDDYLHGFSAVSDEPVKERGKTILDLEKESVVLMAEALEGLGDSYAVCGFSGYGRDRVEFYVCKDFDEPYNYHAKGNIGGIKPCRSTRMGPAIRHASKMLAATESRIKALIIISDGYPQDFDYGQDRNSKDYGIKDTTRALTEASQQGVQSFCLTVDPSGHDYLREMCPDQQYMVMQDITQLPDELSKVYRGLTS